MRVLINFCFTASIIPAVASLSCQSCPEAKAESCSASEVLCGTSEDSCLVSQMIIMYEQSTVRFPQKSCGIPEVCNISHSITMDKIHMTSLSQCCKTNNCNKDIPQFPPRNVTKNSLKCPNCFEKGLSGCTAKNDSLCTGLETKCINFAGYLGFEGSAVAVSYQGCATPSSCQPPAHPSHNSKGGNRISCTDAIHHYTNEGAHS